MLVLPYHLPVFHVREHSVQEDLPHDLSRHRYESDRSVVPGVILFTLQWICYLFSSHQGFHLIVMTFQIPQRVAWCLHQPVPLGLWDASHWDPQTCGCSGCSGVLNLNLIFAYSFPNPLLPNHVFEICVASSYQGRHRQKSC